MNGTEEMAALVRAIDGDAEFELALGELVGKQRKKREKAIRDMEAARLLPRGAEVVSVLQRCHRSTSYRRAERGRKLSRQIPADATLP